MKNILLIILLSLLMCCVDNSNEKSLDAAKQTATLDGKIANEIGANFAADSGQITREIQHSSIGNDKEIVTLTYYFFNDIPKTEELASVVALMFYDLSQTNQLKQYDIIKVLLKSNNRIIQKAYNFIDFKRSSPSLKNLELFFDAVGQNKYSELTNFIDISVSNQEVTKTLKMYRNIDSIYGKMDNLTIVSVDFPITNNHDTLTEVQLSANHNGSNIRTRHVFEFNNKTNKIQFINIKLIDK